MNLKANDNLPLTIQAEDKFGNQVGALDTPPTWSVADTTMGAVAPATDGMSAVFTPSGKEGSTQVQVAGAVNGATIMGSLDVTILAGDAAQIVIQPGTPAAQ